MAMKYNKLRKILNEHGSSVATRMWSSNPFFTELLGQNATSTTWSLWLSTLPIP